MIFPI